MGSGMYRHNQGSWRGLDAGRCRWAALRWGLMRLPLGGTAQYAELEVADFHVKPARFQRDPRHFIHVVLNNIHGSIFKNKIRSNLTDLPLSPLDVTQFTYPTQELVGPVKVCRVKFRIKLKFGASARWKGQSRPPTCYVQQRRGALLWSKGVSGHLSLILVLLEHKKQHEQHCGAYGETRCC
ncbi:hypothetical protein K439DRAFT_1570722, partial [Ramaria rubella]